MKTPIVIFLAAFQTTVTYGQKLCFSKEGTMDRSRFVIDTIFNLKFKSSNDSLFFNRIDSGSVSHLKAGFKKFHKYLSRDSNDGLEYFYIYNATGTDLRIRREDRRIVAIELASIKNTRYLPINFFMHFNEVYQSGDLVLPPQAILIIKSTAPVNKGGTKAFVRIKVKISNNQFIISSPFERYIDENSFCMNANLEKDYELGKRYIDFLNQ